jgi:hypothetical protein
MIFASEYKKNNKYISDMLLNLINWNFIEIW